MDYRPSRVTARSSAQDKAGYETRIEEVFEWIGKARLRQLGLLTNKEYWDTLKGSGVTVYIDGNGRPRRAEYDPAMPRLMHEARAERDSVAVPVDVVYGGGDVDEHVLRFVGPAISRDGPENDMYSNKSLDQYLRRLTCGWCSDRAAARSAAIYSGQSLHAMRRPKYDHQESHEA